MLAVLSAAGCGGLQEQLAALASRITRLERGKAGPCDSSRPYLSDTRYSYYGVDRNVPRNSTRSIETHQNGTVTLYNVSQPEGASAHLFDAAIAAADPQHDEWHFVCTLTASDPHLAYCTLTFETPPRPEGPAWVRIRFRQLARDAAGRCIAGERPQPGAPGSHAYTQDTHTAVLPPPRHHHHPYVLTHEHTHALL